MRGIDGTSGYEMYGRQDDGWCGRRQGDIRHMNLTVNRGTFDSNLTGIRMAGNVALLCIQHGYQVEV